MKDYARIGDLTLEVLSGVTALSEDSGYDYAEHSLISGKQLLQAMGSKLRKVSLTVSLKGYIHSDITATMDKLGTIRDSGEAQHLLFGDGTYTGSFVLIAMSSKVDKTYKDGTLSDVTLELTLREAVEREVVKVSRVERKPARKQKQESKRITAPGSITPLPVGEEDLQYKSFFDQIKGNIAL